VRFIPLELKGAYVIEPELARDERGTFARTFCRDEFLARGLVGDVAQCSTSFNRARATLRGLHFQIAPSSETRLVRCTRGRVWDVLVDLRGASPTFGRWCARELSADNGFALYVPEGFAHGYITLEDETELCYQMSVPYDAERARGVRWDDPSIAIAWPIDPRTISAKDRGLPLLATARL
jgi:dTDP-4-dehydrorhamnose 3,5-epimerase